MVLPSLLKQGTEKLAQGSKKEKIVNNAISVDLCGRNLIVLNFLAKISDAAKLLCCIEKNTVGARVERCIDGLFSFIIFHKIEIQIMIDDNLSSDDNLCS